MLDYKKSSNMKVHAKIESFDKKSGSWFEGILFNNRIVFLSICIAITIFLGIKSLDVRINADFNDTIPTQQSFIVNYLKHYADLQSQANAVEISVTAKAGTIIDQNYLDTLKGISDKIYLLPGVDRPFMTSLWTPNTRWIAVTADGLDSGPVIGDTYDASPKQLEIVRQNILKTGEVGKLVSDDFKSRDVYKRQISIRAISPRIRTISPKRSTQSRWARARISPARRATLMA